MIVTTYKTECGDRPDLDELLTDRQQEILKTLRESFYYFTTGKRTRPETVPCRKFVAR